MNRLPVVGGDRNRWGAILNSLWRVIHRDDGYLKDDIVANIREGLATEEVVNEAVAQKVGFDLYNLTHDENGNLIPERVEDIIHEMQEFVETKALAEATADQVEVHNTEKININTYWHSGRSLDDAIDMVIDNIPGAHGGRAGIELIFPWRLVGYEGIARKHTIDKPGVRLSSPGGYGAIFHADDSLTDVMWEFKDTSYVMRGPQMDNIAIDMGNSSAGAIRYCGAYDQASMSNIFVYNLNGNATGIAIVPNDDADLPISQTFIAENCWVDGKNGSFSGRTWELVRLQEALFLGCKGIGGGENVGGGTAFYAENCKKLVFLGPSAATAEIGFHLVSADGDTTDAVLIDTPTFEGLVNSIVTDGESGLPVVNVQLRNPRKQVGTSLEAGPIILNHALSAVLETKSIEVQIASTSTMTEVRTLDASKVTDNGYLTTLFESPNASFANDGTYNLPGRSGVKAKTSPQFRWGVHGRNDYWIWSWSANVSDDYGFVEQYFDGSNALISRFVAPDIASQSLYANDGAGGTVATLTVDNPAADTQVGMLVLTNTGGTRTLKRVTVGATDSGGSGYRVLRVPN